jgi:hypothetical protein
MSAASSRDACPKRNQGRTLPAEKGARENRLRVPHHWSTIFSDPVGVTESVGTLIAVPHLSGRCSGSFGSLTGFPLRAAGRFPAPARSHFQGSQYSLPGPEAAIAFPRIVHGCGAARGAIWGSRRGVSGLTCGSSSDSTWSNRTGCVSPFASALCCIASPFLSCAGDCGSVFCRSRRSVKHRQL